MSCTRLVLCFAALLLCACHREGESSAAIEPGVRRLSFTLLEAPDAAKEPEVILPIVIPRVLGEDCAASNETVELVEVDTAEGKVPGIRFKRPGIETNLRVFCEFSGGDYDLLRLRMATRGRFQLRGLAQRQGLSISTEIQSHSFDGEPQIQVGPADSVFHTLEFDFDELRHAEGLFTELVLHKPRASTFVVITGIELVRRGGRPLPAVGGESTFVERTVALARDDSPSPPKRRDLKASTSVESRPAVGLREGAVLGVNLGDLFPGAGFACDAMLATTGPIQDAEAGSGEIELRLRSASGERVATERHTLGRSWQTIRPEFLGAILEGASLEIECTLGAPALLSCPRLEPRVTTPRTVLLITSDTHRADHVGFSSPPGFVATPNLDALKTEGMSFLNCYSQTNITNPSHVALMTAFHPRDSGIVNNFSMLADEARTLAEEFADAGYLTFASVSAPHLYAEYAGLRQGFDRVVGPKFHLLEADSSVRVMKDWMEEAGDAPVFAWLHLFDAHFPYVPPIDLDRKYYPDDRDPTDPSRSLPQVEGDVIDFLREDGITDAEYAPAQYRAEVDALDRALGPLLSLPRVDAGIVAFTADHGEALGERGIYCAHIGLYPATLHVPLVLRWPGGPSGIEIATPVEMYDIGRTLLNLAQIPAPEFPGSDLSANPTAKPRFALAPQGDSASLEEEGYLCVLHLRFRRQRLSKLVHELGMVELFHLSVDPMAESDLLLEDFERARAMRRRIIDWLEDETAPRFGAQAAKLNEAQMEGLRDLGYTGDSEDPDDNGGMQRWWRPQDEDSNWTDSPWRRLFEEEAFGLDEFRKAKGR